MIDALKSLAVFARTVECGSFRGAARRLGLSPSVVSHHVASLEDRLGTPLLYRSTRAIALTPDGERLFAAARAMVEEAERGLDAVAGRGSAPVGHLRVTMPAVLTATPFCRDVAAFAAAHPKVTLELAFADHRRDLLRDGFDLAIRIGWPEDSALMSRRLAEMPRVLVGAPSCVGRQAAPADPDELVENWDWIALGALKPEVAFHGAGGAVRTVAFAPRVSVDSATAMRELALAGLGIAVLPEVTVRDDLAAGRLVPLLPGWRVPAPGVFAMWPGNTPRPGLTLRFVAFVEDRLRTIFRNDERAAGEGPGRP